MLDSLLNFVVYKDSKFLLTETYRAPFPVLVPFRKRFLGPMFICPINAESFFNFNLVKLLLSAILLSNDLERAMDAMKPSKSKEELEKYLNTNVYEFWKTLAEKVSDKRLMFATLNGGPGASHIYNLEKIIMNPPSKATYGDNCVLDDIAYMSRGADWLFENAAVTTEELHYLFENTTTAEEFHSELLKISPNKRWAIKSYKDIEMAKSGISRKEAFIELFGMYNAILGMPRIKKILGDKAYDDFHSDLINSVLTVPLKGYQE